MGLWEFSKENGNMIGLAVYVRKLTMLLSKRKKVITP
jgi:hypothetical protein